MILIQSGGASSRLTEISYLSQTPPDNRWRFIQSRHRIPPPNLCLPVLTFKRASKTFKNQHVLRERNLLEVGGASDVLALFRSGA